MSDMSESVEKSEQAKFNEIIKTLSHDIREDLRIILGFIDLLDERYSKDLEKDHDFKKFIFYIVEYAQKLQGTNEDLIKMCEDMED